MSEAAARHQEWATFITQVWNVPTERARVYFRLNRGEYHFPEGYTCIAVDCAVGTIIKNEGPRQPRRVQEGGREFFVLWNPMARDILNFMGDKSGVTPELSMFV